MRQITAKTLKLATDDILQHVHDDGEQFEVVRGNEVIARIIPLRPRGVRRDLAPEERIQIDALLDDLDRLATEIGKTWPDGVSAVDAVRDVRRDL